MVKQVQALLFSSNKRAKSVGIVQWLCNAVKLTFLFLLFSQKMAFYFILKVWRFRFAQVYARQEKKRKEGTQKIYASQPFFLLTWPSPSSHWPDFTWHPQLQAESATSKRIRTVIKGMQRKLISDRQIDSHSLDLVSTSVHLGGKIGIGNYPLEKKLYFIKICISPHRLI